MGGTRCQSSPLKSICSPLSRPHSTLSPWTPGQGILSQAGLLGFLRGCGASSLETGAQPVPSYYSACIRSQVLLLGHYEALISQAFSCPLVYIIKN